MPSRGLQALWRRTRTAAALGNTSLAYNASNVYGIPSASSSLAPVSMPGKLPNMLLVLLGPNACVTVTVCRCIREAHCETVQLG
jgi:hypothetical protein